MTERLPRFTIRPLQPENSLRELTALLHAAYAQLAALGFNYTAADQSEAITRERTAGGECFVAEQQNQIVGTILFCDPPRSHGCAWFDRPEVASFHQFAVLPSLHGQGIGAALLAFVETRAQISGAAELALDTAEGASALVRWYSRHGYRQVGHTRWEGKTYRSLIMSKTLPKL